MQGYTYQNLQDLGFNYVLADYQVMDDDYIKEQGFDREKVLAKIKSQQTKAINETALISYVIMGMKALNDNISKL